MRALLLVLLALPLAPLALAGGGFSISSPAFDDGGFVPAKYSCDGEGLSPPLAISGAPAGTRAVALLVNDPDAPVPVAGVAKNFTHWIAWNAPAHATFPEGGAPAGTVQGTNSANGLGWTPPCPPPGSPPHRYQFVALALDAPLDLAQGARRPAFESALAGRVLASATLTGCYMRLAPALPDCLVTPAAP